MSRGIYYAKYYRCSEKMFTGVKGKNKGTGKIQRKEENIASKKF